MNAERLSKRRPQRGQSIPASSSMKSASLARRSSAASDEVLPGVNSGGGKTCPLNVARCCETESCDGI